MSNLLNAAITDNYAVLTRASVNSNRASLPNKLDEITLQLEKKKRNKQLALAFSGLAVLGITSTLVGKKIKNAEIKRLKEESFEIIKDSKEICNTGYQVLNETKKFTNELKDKIQKAIKTNPNSITELTDGKSVFEEFSGNTLITSTIFSKNTDNLILHSIIQKKPDGKFNKIIFDENNFIKNIFSNISKLNNDTVFANNIYEYNENSLTKVCYGYLNQSPDNIIINKYFNFGENKNLCKFVNNCHYNPDKSTKVKELFNFIDDKIKNVVIKTKMKNNILILDKIYHFKNGDYFRTQKFSEYGLKDVGNIKPWTEIMYDIASGIFD